MAFKPIQIIINAKDNASAVFTSLQAKVAAVGAAIASYFGFQAFKGVVQGAADLEAAMSRVQAATGASADEMKQLRQVVQDAGANTKFSAVEAAAAVEELGKAGVSAADSIKALPKIINLAEAANIGLGRATEVATSVVMGLGLAFSDIGRVTDVLAMGANATKTSIEGLGQALSYAAPIAKGLGLSLEFTTAMIGQFAQSGIDASRAGTALNSILSQFSDPASKFREQLALIGITTNKFEAALHQLAAAGPEGAAAINAVGLEAGPALRAMLNQGMGALDELKAKLLDSAGSAEATAKIMRDNLAGSMQSLSSIWQTVLNVLGTPVLPVLRDGVDQLTGALRGAVADGTVAKFGEALATAFRNGIQWVRDFLGTVNFDEVIARVQNFAKETNQTFQSISASATLAGQIVKTAYGVMAAGGNAVLTVIYAIGADFSVLLASISRGMAAIYEASAKLSFGVASERFKQAAEEARSVSEGYAAAAKALHDKAVDSFNGVANGAEIARNGFEGVSKSLNDIETAAGAASKPLSDVDQALRSGAEAAARYGLAQQQKIQADELARQSAEAAARAMEEQRAKLEELRAEYSKQFNLGNLQGMIDAQTQIDALQKAIAASAQEAGAKQAQSSKDAAAALEAHRAKLDELWNAYRKQIDLGNFQEALKVMGQINEVQNAFTKSVQESAAQIEQAAKALEARNRVIEASLALESAKEQAYEAEMRAIGNLYAATQSQIRQKEIEIKVIEAKVKAMNAEADATIRAAEAKMRELRENDEGVAIKRAELQNTIELAKAKKLEADAIEASTGKLRADITALRNGTSERDRHSQSARNMAGAVDAVTAALERENAERERMIAAQEKALALTEREDALRRKKLNIDKDGFTLDANGQRMQQSVPTGNFILEAAKGQGLDEKIALELLDRFFQNGRGVGTTPGSDWFSTVNQAIADRVVEETRRRVAQGGAGGGAGGGGAPTSALPQAPSAPAPAPAPAPAVSVGQPVTVHINMGSAIDLGSRAGLEGLARQLMPAINNLARRGFDPSKRV